MKLLFAPLLLEFSMLDDVRSEPSAASAWRTSMFGRNKVGFLTSIRSSPSSSILLEALVVSALCFETLDILFSFLIALDLELIPGDSI